MTFGNVGSGWAVGVPDGVALGATVGVDVGAQKSQYVRCGGVGSP
jgi:hypothetical protein